MMNRSLAVAAVAFLGVGPVAARAQHFGIKGGFAYSDVTNGGLFPGGATHRNGFAVGAGVSAGDGLGVGVEALYAQRGVLSPTVGDGRELNYLDIPIYLRLGVRTPGISPFAYAGPQVSFELECYDRGVDCPDTGRQTTTYAGVIGGGLRFGMFSGLSLEARYLYGLTNLRLTTVTTQANYRTRSLLVLAGVSF